MSFHNAEKPLVSFVVMCYNTERYVGECIQSILDQKGEYSWEIVAVDDCSQDGTAAVLDSFKDPRIRFIRHTVNQGPNDSALEGLRATRGVFLTRMDSDDRYRPEFLSRTMPVFEQNPDVGLVYGDAALINDRGEQTLATCDRRHGGRDFKGNELVPLLEENFICNPTVVARREGFLDALPVPDQMMLGDWYFTVNMARRWNFYYVNRVLADYRLHGGNFHNRIVTDRSEERSVEWLLDHVFAFAENSPALEAEKQSARGRIYGANYLTLGNKYFGFGMYADARRCYFKALQHRPGYLFSTALQQRLAATVLGRERYERWKTRIQAGRLSSASN